MVMMFARSSKPFILRLHGNAEVVEAHHAEFAALKSQFRIFRSAFDHSPRHRPHRRLVRLDGTVVRVRRDARLLRQLREKLGPKASGRDNSPPTCVASMLAGAGATVVMRRASAVRAR
jgi:hypothetical protein